MIRLQPQPAQVLGCLLMRRGEVVSREELCEAVWGSKTFVDFERGLNFCIAQIRSALGDDSATPRYVRTVPKRGYQFIAPVEAVGAVMPTGAVETNAPLEAVSDPVVGTDTPKMRRRIPATAILVCCGLVLVAAGLFAGYRLHKAYERRHPIVAVLRFDNETGDASMTRFSDGLTDTLVGQLTTLGGQQYGVIGNATILRLPRNQRDLRTIAATLHARYVVLGQVQGSGKQTRVLAHLIRMPEQTHVWVTRLDRNTVDTLGAESDAAEKIAAEFSQAVVRDSTGSPLPKFVNR